MWEKQKGFTIVELLIVVVVIAILAAITIVSYRGVQNQSYDSIVRSDLTTFSKQIENVKTDSPSNRYPDTLTSAMGFGFAKNAYGQDDQNRNVRYCYNVATDSYILYAISKSGNAFKSINSKVEQAGYAHGYNVCSQIGLVNTNPSYDGFWSSRSTPWASWTN